MSALWIVEAFDPVEDSECDFARILEFVSFKQLAFESGIEALARRVVVALGYNGYRPGARSIACSPPRLLVGPGLMSLGSCCWRS
jgi:hypothetical protein